MRGEVTVKEGKIWSMAATEEELGKNSDEMCIFKLDGGLHEEEGITSKIAEVDFFLN